MGTLLLGTVRGREAIQAMIRRQWEEVDTQFEVRDIQDAGERQAVGTAVFIVTAHGIEQRQTLAYLFISARDDKQTLDGSERELIHRWRCSDVVRCATLRRVGQAR